VFVRWGWSSIAPWMLGASFLRNATSHRRSAPGRRAVARRIGGTGIICLNWRTRHRAIRTENATVATLRAQHRAASSACVIDLAGIGWHAFRLGSSTKGAGDKGFKNHDRLAIHYAVHHQKTNTAAALHVFGSWDQTRRSERKAFHHGVDRRDDNQGQHGRRHHAADHRHGDTLHDL
jgi:hypothetical protein